MQKKILSVIMLFFLIQHLVSGQLETYTVNNTGLGSKKSDVFSPVYYKKGIVFCTNNSPSSLFKYFAAGNKRKINIYYISSSRNLNPGSAKLFSKTLSSKVNDGPVAFNRTADTIYFSRNQDPSKHKNNTSIQGNRLGIFTAILVGNTWTKIREFRYNSDKYNLTAPCLSADGRKLFFASDQPGGYGGYDLYYSKWEKGYWNKPENLGSVINTTGNESFPFVNSSGDLFFSSDGLPGLGGMDLFFTQFSDNEWKIPIGLDPPINSKGNDFGMITDSILSEGYFSSDRNKPIDIYHFKTNFAQVFYSSIQKDNHYCFIFRDTATMVVDTSNLKYVWTFGDAKASETRVAQHCFKGPGNYKIRLDIIDRHSGNIYFSKLSYDLKIVDIEQPFISSPVAAVKGSITTFSGSDSYLPGYTVLNYSWNFGDGTRSVGQMVKHTYTKKGNYLVNMGVTLQSISDNKIIMTGISKNITVFDNNDEKITYMTNEAHLNDFRELTGSENATVTYQHPPEADLSTGAVFVIELQSSRNQIRSDSKLFSTLPKKYRIGVSFNPDDSLYSYYVDQQMSLMAAYPAYRELTSLGYKNARVKMNILKSEPEKELHNLIRVNGAFADSYFDNTGKLTSDALIMMDQIYKLMKKYPDMRLEFAVHTDNTGPAETSLALTQHHSQLLVNNLINRGISAKRMVATGFGGSKPIASNYLEKDRKLNRRIDFIIIK